MQVSQNGVAQLSYTYDAMGRRTSKAVQGGTPTQFLYDGAKAVQETQGSGINPILIGPGVDERYARNDVTGRTYFLTDAIGNTVGLTDTTGAIREQYSYDLYGNATLSDNTTGFMNPYQYTGREADTPGLYYYRARYYSPMMAGFISEDPIGFGGGQLSFYAGFRGDPLDFNDPYGLWSVSLQGYVGFGGGVVLTGTGFSLNSIGFRLGYGSIGVVRIAITIFSSPSTAMPCSPTPSAWWSRSTARWRDWLSQFPRIAFDTRARRTWREPVRQYGICKRCSGIHRSRARRFIRG